MKKTKNQSQKDRKETTSKRMIKFCPKCYSTNIEALGYGLYSQYKCLDCGYVGTNFPEIEEDKINKLKEMKEKKKEKEE